MSDVAAPVGELQLLQEFVGWSEPRPNLDRPQAVLRGVKILGLASRNGRTYAPAALAAAAGLYEGAKVNVNHPKGDPAQPRDYQDRLGVVRHVRFRPQEGLFADLYFNPRHPLAEQLLWDAEHAPQQAGLSHNVQARVVARGGQTVVEEILRVHSVDLVADPAATQGLFESTPSALEPSALTLDLLRAERPDLVAALLAEAQAELAGLQAELAALREDRRRAARRAELQQALAEHGLPPLGSRARAAQAVLSPSFLAAAEQAPDEACVRRLVEERAELVRSFRLHGLPPAHDQPRACEQGRAESSAEDGAYRAFLEAVA